LILLDTNVLSEVLKPSPDVAVQRWLNVHFPDSAASAVSILELLGGAVILPLGRRRKELESAIERIFRRFAGRIYAFDDAAARASVQLLENARKRGRGGHTLPDKLADLQIAGTARAHGLSLATRDVSDFEEFGLELINPWQP
jgi:predicted nucleic acid-binding protein